MRFGEVMLYLQQNSYYGSIVTMCIVVFFYILASVLFIVLARRSSLNICASGMVPVYNLHIPVRVIIRKIKEKNLGKGLNNSEEDITIDEDEEITF